MKSKIIILLAGFFFFFSCDDILEEQPYDFIKPDQVGDSNAAADTWVMGVYNELSLDNYGWGIHPKLLEYDCDYVSGPDWAFAAFGAGNFQGEANIDDMWDHPYIIIHRANMGIQSVSQMKNVTERHKTNCIGELYFMKAYAYFLLVRAFGEVPIFTKTVNEGESYYQPRQSISTVYAYIIELLSDAKDMMYKNTESGFKEGRPCAASAAALLAKTYATMASGALPSTEYIRVKGGPPVVNNGGTAMLTLPVESRYQKTLLTGYDSFDPKVYYALAKTLVKEIITDKKYGDHSLFDHFTDIWQSGNKNKREHLFALQAKAGDDVFGNSLAMVYTGVENDAGYLTQGLWTGGRWHWYNLFEKGDERIEQGVMHKWHWWDSSKEVPYEYGSFYPNNEEWVKKSQGYTDDDGNSVPPVPPFDDGVIYITDISYLAYPTKYYFVTNRAQEKTDAIWPILRLADVYLIGAEASNELDGPNQDALWYLNEIRRRSNASQKNLADFATKEALRSTVIEERARELAFEGDRRWDLIRWGIYLPVMNAIGGNDERGVKKTRENKHLLFPIPSSEISTNKNIHSNNPGWN